MKEITIRVTDAAAARILPAIISEVDEINVTRCGDDPPLLPAPTAEPTDEAPILKRKMHRGDKTARDIVLELLDTEPVRSMHSVTQHLVAVGFGANTGSATMSKMASDGLIKRINREIIQLIPEDERETTAD